MKSSTSGLRETKELLWLRSVWQGIKVGWPDSKGATFETNATREAMALQKEAPRNDNFALWCDLQGLESARQTAPTKRKVYEDFTTTLMRRRENRVWSSYRKRRREPSWGKKNADERYSYGFVALLCLSITQDRVLLSGLYTRRFGRGHRRFSVRREQRRRTKLGEFGKRAKSARRGRDFRYREVCTSCTTGAQCPCRVSVAPTRACLRWTGSG